MLMKNDRIVFFETASIFEENWVKRDTVNALRNHATGAGGGVVVGCDLYNGNITGDVACNMNANSNASANQADPTIIVMCDQGGYEWT